MFRILVLCFALLLPMGCAYQPQQTQSQTQYEIPTFIQSAVKTWQIIDISANTTFTIAGDLYSRKLITTSQKNQIIEMGNILYSSLQLTKTSIQNYIWLKSSNLDATDTETLIRNNFKVIVTTYTQIKALLDSILKTNTSYKITLPNITLSPDLQ